MCNNHKKVKYFKACLIINDFIYKEQYNVNGGYKM